MKKRSEADSKYTWKLEDMVADRETWEQLYKEAVKEAERYEEFKGKLAESADVLYEALKFDDTFSEKIERLYVYARMRSDEDTADQEYQDMFSRAQSLSFRAGELSAFMIPEILGMPDGQLALYCRSENGISHYRRLLEQLAKRKAHTLSHEMEGLLARSKEATQGGAQIFRMFNNADVRFPSITGSDGRELPVTHGSFISLMENPERKIRKSAFESLYGVYKQYSNTLPAAFAANVKQAVFYARARKYDSSRSYYLNSNEVPEEVYDRLTASVRKGLPKLHRYISLRKRLLKTDDLHMYDLYVPLVAEADRPFSFQEAKEMVKEGLAPLGEVYGCHPYVLLNFQGTLKDVFTLAHEMGHAIHTWYSNEAQPYTYAGYRIFVAEVASTCNEALLIRHLLETSKDRKERAYLLNHFLESFRTTLFRQTMFAEFEQKAHEMGSMRS